MTLRGARIAVSATESSACDVAMRSGRITFAPHPDDEVLNVRGYLILPGLINAHDHLEFALFPRLGRGPYRNATAWAEDIYRPEQAPIRQHLQVPKAVRFFWGGIRNLLAGVTTVMHHNPYVPDVFRRRFPVRVVSRYGWAHSPRFSPDIAERHRATPKAAPFILHACEGTDFEARGELRQVDRAGALGRLTVIVHGVGIDREGAALMKARRAALVWCPTSNRFTLGRTLSQDALGSGMQVALGTDSSLTADGDMVDELDSARRYADPVRVYEMVTRAAAEILCLNRGEGGITEGGVADLVVIRDTGGRPADALAAFDPQLVIVGGRIKLSTPEMADRLGLGRLNLQPVHVEGRGIKLVDCDVRSMAQTAVAATGEELRLGGKLVTA